MPEGHTTFESLRAAAPVMREAGMDSAFLVSDPWHNARVERMARDLGIDGHASATWQSAATSQETRAEGYSARRSHTSITGCSADEGLSLVAATMRL